MADDINQEATPKAPAIKTSKKSEINEPKALSESQLKAVQKEFEASKEYQKMDNRLDRWHTHKEYLNCRWNDPESTNDEITAVNTIWSNAQTELPQLYFRHPTASLTPESDFFPATIGGQEFQIDNLFACKLFSIRLNNVVKNMRVEPVWERIIMDSLAPYGYGIGKVGYALTTESEWTNEYDRTSYWFRWLDPRNITFDLFADDFSGLSGTFESIVRMRSDLQSNPNYDKKKIADMRKIAPQDKSLPEALRSRLNKAGKNYEPDLVCFTEYHDMKNRCIRWLDLEGTPQELRRPVKRNRWFEGSDYIFTALNVHTDDCIYPLSDVEPIVDQAVSRNKTRTAIEGHVRNWGTTVIVPDDIPDEQLEKYKVINDRLILRLPREVIGNIITQSPPPISGDWYRLDEIDRRDNSETLGLPEYMQQGSKKTATHDILSSNAFATRINRRRQKIKLSIIEMYRKVAGLLQEYDRGDTKINLGEHVEDKELMDYLKDMSLKSGDKRPFNPKKPFFSAGREWWQGEYGFDYEVEEQLDRPKAVQVQQLNNTVATVSQNPFLNRALFDDPKTPKKIVQKLFELQGWNLEELRSHRSVGAIPVTIENEMVEAGDPARGVDARDLPLPLPSEQDIDPEHLVGHYRLMREMQDKAQPLLMKAVKTPIDIATIEFLQKSIAKLQKHMMLHDLQMKQKQEKDTMAFAGPQAQGPQGAQTNPQAMMPNPNGPPPPNQGAMMGAGNTMA